MLLILEVILTISAWRRGWKGWALLPVAGGLFIAFLVGASSAASGGSTGDLGPAALFIDIACIGILGAMTAYPRKNELSTLEPSNVGESAEKT